MAFAGFGKESGPSAPPKGPIPFGSFPTSNPSPPPPPPPLANQDPTSPLDKRVAVSPNWDSQPKQSVGLAYTEDHQRLSPVAAYATANDVDGNFSSDSISLHSAKRSRSPPLSSRDNSILENSISTNANIKRISVSPSWGSQTKQSVNLAYTTSHQGVFPVAAYATVSDVQGNFPSEPINLQAAKRSRSPPLPSSDNGRLENSSSANPIFRRLGSHPDMQLDNVSEEPIKRTRLGNQSVMRLDNGTGEPSKKTVSLSSTQNLNVSLVEAQRYTASPLRVGSERNLAVNDANSSPSLKFESVESNSDAHDGGGLSPSRPTNFNGSKRARSPPLLSDMSSTPSSILLDSERETQAKAKRLARFSAELSQPFVTSHDLTSHKSSGVIRNQVSVGNQNRNDPAKEAERLATGGILSDNEGFESSKVVVGLCPDMCPELEREERQRKGDLDKFERMDGERNQTSKFLAVKKYNRTAEREADLIRPMPVLQKTVDYLLNLLDQPYNENFLSIYNFLWDRMRAIRMDLRMQHIFNQEAVLMLEQMIRLHIIAMHELCEYKKGEGFTEGFDAHLNIEQMNKTSVELFQIYDDHRKKGNVVPTEKEFRGYYALLKLDKHPGYKVEPAELSLDLAKMTHEMRCTPEILFARDVARACRINNYIAFFRLARKATYLQACLMHAHFGKLRTQALASLHSGLQNNQGIPFSHVVQWLGMEGEDIESLLEYHGFSIRNYEEKYMVKEGPFLNSDNDFPTKRSELVHLKKSGSIADDVRSCQVLPQRTEEEAVPDDVHVVAERINTPKAETRVDVMNEEKFDLKNEKLDFKAGSSPRVAAQPRQLLEVQRPSIWSEDTNVEMTHISPTVNVLSPEDGSPSIDKQNIEDGLMTSFVGLGEVTSMDSSSLLILEENIVQAEVPGTSEVDHMLENPVPKSDAGKILEIDAPVFLPPQKDEAAREKLKLIIRKWKKQSAMQREIRKQRELLANAALSSLSLGPPIRLQSKVAPNYASQKLDIDYVVRERDERQRKSWSSLNVAEVIAPTLSTRNLDAKCICWKLIIIVQENDTESKIYNLASRWLLSKLMGTGKGTDDDLVFSSPHISIWKKWNDTESSPIRTCCLSVIRESVSGKNLSVPEQDLICGTSCFMFLVSASISWEIQRARLHELIASIQSGSSLPLLILSCDSFVEDISEVSHTIINELGIQGGDTTKINCSSVTFLADDSLPEHADGFFSDSRLRQGLHWLASHSPIQPAVDFVNIRERILSYLRCSTSALDSLKASEVVPSDCIAAFNGALGRLGEEIRTAASSNPNQWPSPEIDLLEKSSKERIAAEMYLPTVGWSSATKIEPLLRAIEDCKLPDFPNDMPWLKRGSSIGSQIQNQKLAVEECLVSYLTQSAQLLEPDLAAREASIMLQKGAGLELRGSYYHIVPRWLQIFRRIYNWRLLRLNRKEISHAYVLHHVYTMDLERKDDADTPFQSAGTSVADIGGNFGLGGYYVHTELSLDELVDVSCSDPSKEQLQPVARHQPSLPESTHERSYDSRPEFVGSKNNEDPRLTSSEDISQAVNRHVQKEAPVATKSDSRLAVLLEQCNRLQDRIAKKLAVYF